MNGAARERLHFTLGSAARIAGTASLHVTDGNEALNERDDSPVPALRARKRSEPNASVSNAARSLAARSNRKI